MERNTDLPTDGHRKAKHLEIADFELEISNGLYWLRHGGRCYPTILTPYDFKRLFEIEGTPIEDFAGDEPVRFSKAILMKREGNICGDVFDEEGDDITPQPCWVKETNDEISTHP